VLKLTSKSKGKLNLSFIFIKAYLDKSLVDKLKKKRFKAYLTLLCTGKSTKGWGLTGLFKHHSKLG